MKIYVINQKVGTGKTTTAIHLAAALAKRNRKALFYAKEAPSHGLSLYEYAPNCTASRDYLHFVDELLSPNALR